MVRVIATELMPDFSGQLLNKGRYRLLEKLGAGAYGKVYRALDTTSPPDKPVHCAIKCLDRHPPGSEKDVLQQREFTLHKLVSGHPNIVTFYDHFKDDLYVYAVLELCLGGDLFGAITEKHSYRNDTHLIKVNFIQILDAIQHCHDLGIFHRDIKPENVLCSEDGRIVRLADFGLSINSAVCRDFGCGSSYYMSPECIGAKDAGLEVKYSTRHNDVWALGIILTNIITGRNPWRYATSDDDCYAAYLQDNNFLRQVLPISSGVNAILKRIFTTNPLRRITIPDLRQKIIELDTFFAEEKVTAAQPRSRLNHRTPAKAKGTQTAPARIVFAQDAVQHDSSKSSFDSDEQYAFASPTDDHPGVVRSPIMQISDVFRSGNPDDFTIGNSDLSLPPSSDLSGSSGSGPDSKGPITPATQAADPDIAVPDFSSGGLGEPISIPIVKSKSKATNPLDKSKKRSTRSAKLFKSAYQRIKALPN